MLVVCFNFNLFTTIDWAVEPGDGEATFKCGAVWCSAAEGELVISIENGGVEIEFGFWFEAWFGGEIGDETSEVNSDLGKGEADSFGFFGIGDGVDEGLNLRLGCV